MANTFITPTVIAKMGLITLLNNLCFSSLVFRDFSKEFRKIGSSVRIKKPFTPTAVEFDGDLAGEWQTITETYIDVPMDTLLVIPLTITAQELTLDITDFNKQVMEPAMQELAQAIDVKLAQLYKDIPYYQDITETSEATIIASLLGARKIQNDLKVPFGTTRYAVMSPQTTALLLALSAFHEVDKVGETKPLRDASLGRKFGYEFYENQNIQCHDYGESTLEAAGTVNGAHAAGAATLAVTSHGVGTIKKGTIITVADNTGQYVVTADTLLAGTAATLPIYPVLNAAIDSGKVSTLHAEATTSKENLMFHRNAFSMVSAPLAPPIGGAEGAFASYNGLTLNVVKDYDTDKFTNKLTVSILCGFKTLTPELAVRLYDAS